MTTYLWPGDTGWPTPEEDEREPLDRADLDAETDFDALALHAPPPPREHAPGLDAGWQRIILRCLAREPGERYASATEVARSLEQALARSGALSAGGSARISRLLSGSRGWYAVAGLLKSDVR